MLKYGEKKDWRVCIWGEKEMPFRMKDYLSGFS